MNSSPQQALADPHPFAPRLSLGEHGARVVKRYGNRKLYDTATSRYVKLVEVAELIRSGVEVNVIDHASGRDVTSAALAHIIFDEEVKASRRRTGVLAAVIRGRAAVATGGAAPGVDPRDAPRDPEERSRHAVSDARRAVVCAGQRLAAAVGAVDRLREAAGARTCAAHQVLDAVARARRDLSRIEKQIGALHERIRALDA